MAHLTNFSFEFFYEIFTEDASQLLLYHGAKKSKMTKNPNQGGGPALTWAAVWQVVQICCRKTTHSWSFFFAMHGPDAILLQHVMAPVYENDDGSVQAKLYRGNTPWLKKSFIRPSLPTVTWPCQGKFPRTAQKLSKQQQRENPLTRRTETCSLFDKRAKHSTW